MFDRYWIARHPLGRCLILVALLGLILSADPPRPLPTGYYNPGKKPDEQATEQAAVKSLSITPPITRTDPGAHTHDSKSESDKDYKIYKDLAKAKAVISRWVAINITETDTLAQWIMAIFGVVATGISIWAVILLKRTLEATRETVREAERATAAAEATTTVTRQVAEVQLRAYLSLTPGQVLCENDMLTVIVVQENHGSTPAKNVRFSFGFHACAYPLPTFVNISPTIFGTEVKTIAPGQRFLVYRAKIEIDDAFLNTMASKEIELYFIGRLEYDDIYGKPQTTTACWSYNPFSLWNIKAHFANTDRRNEPMSTNWNYAARYNDAT